MEAGAGMEAMTGGTAAAYTGVGVGAGRAGGRDSSRGSGSDAMAGGATVVRAGAGAYEIATSGGAAGPGSGRGAGDAEDTADTGGGGAREIGTSGGSGDWAAMSIRTSRLGLSTPGGSAAFVSRSSTPG